MFHQSASNGEFRHNPVVLSFVLLFALSPFGHDHYVSRDAGWCWFADPRAIWLKGHLLAGGVSQNGDVEVTDYDPATKSGRTVVLAKNFERDDHDNPSFLPLPDGRILSFFSKHSGADLWMTSTRRAGDLADWIPARKISPNDPTFTGPKGVLNAYCYPNPQLIEREHNRIYLLWRGMNWKPTMSWSNDFGKTWAKGRVIVSPENQDPNNRPYVKVAGDGKRRFHMAFTDGHPRNEPTNSIYYVRYENGAFRRANGQSVATINQLPFRPNAADVVYDGRAEGVRAWIWDVAQDKKGNPVVVYARLPKEDEHLYRYAWWNGRRWVDRAIVAGGKWFPNTPAGKTEPEPHYSGGLCLDPDDPRFVYLSRPVNGRFEIERWFTDDGGDTWSHVAITGASKHDSVRPFVARGERPKVGPQALWVNASRYVHYTDYTSTQQAADEDRGPWNPAKPRRVMDAVWKWVRSNPSDYVKTEWMLAPLYSGVLDYADFTGDKEAQNWVASIGDANAWKLGPRPAMADDQAVGQAYLQFNRVEPDPARIAAVKAWGDAMLARPHSESLEWVNGVANREWAWCDALFMGPPTLAMLASATHDRRYLDLCLQLWQKTSDYLYDPSEQLYFRDSRYFKPREANGQKVFWSRGNGWVLAGLARVLQEIPAGDPARAKLEVQFRAMAARIAKLQTADGTWHASLLDPASYPARETSGTGFYCYALAWGINAGVLEATAYRPVVDRAFRALVEAVDPNGRLGWVQPIGQDPKLVKASDTDTYGVGAFLLAATQVAKLR